ncbi:solute:Na+ symporter, SSS family [Granulicella pectinivorans]|uniref:Solute:Na+ symporter, SSS family n=1 Tax=Granulicella pectinivorans TaxID=474950 RepID=A0A1I6MAV2_9BACT|nr:sodium:solute symporter family protein [Granulicella pectinivorans]SFS12767.1 solute:Na+ symporter, SSS family [Granulicella pectinivorans]
MHLLDWLAISAYFLLMLVVGFVIRRRVHNARDFFTAGGKMPWWLAGISHHMSGYSSAVFVGYAALAYTEGFSLYIWWACTIVVSLLLGSFVFAPRWVRLRVRTGMISPLEYLAARYNVPTQMCLACSGSLLKIFDVGAKWTASALLLQMFAHVDLRWGVLLTGGVTLVYSVMGGLWADAATDLSQFVIQLVSGIAMFVVVLAHLGGAGALGSMWAWLPASHHQLFHGPYTPAFAGAYLLINLLSYNGGTWSLAQRFLASPDETSARRSAQLSAALYLVWPLVLFYPMWAAPILLPHLADPSNSYALLAQSYLPAGMVGLVLAGLFAHSMAMTSSDANAIAAVVIRDIAPVLLPARWTEGERRQLLAARLCTFSFLAGSMVIALFANHMGGVLGLILLWYGALVGPIAVPMLLGMLPLFRRSGAAAAMASWIAGIVTFAVTKRFSGGVSLAFTVGGPVCLSFFTYVVVGLLRPARSPRARELFTAMAASEGSYPLSSEEISTTP